MPRRLIAQTLLLLAQVWNLQCVDPLAVIPAAWFPCPMCRYADLEPSGQGLCCRTRLLWLCWGRQPSSWSTPRFSSVRVSLAAPCNYCPADKMDSGQGLVFVAAAVVALLFLCLPTPQKPVWLSVFCHPATDSTWYGFESSLEPFSLLHFDGEGLNWSQEKVFVSLPEWTL